MKKQKAITLISLVITIIILIILAGVGINLSLGENGIFTRSKQAKDETNKQTATEKINLKITNCQMNKYADEERMPTLKELSLILKEDDEIKYVTESSKVGAAEEYNVPSENPTSIYTKLKQYPYEFEIGDNLKIIKIDGIVVGEENTEKDDNIITSQVYYLGEGNTFDLNTLKEEGRLPKDLNTEGIDIDNFIVGISYVASGTTKKIELDHWSDAIIYGNPISKKYDNGVLTISNKMTLRARATWANGGIATKDLTLNNPTFAYLVIGNINNK